jgi:subtilisin family serine protease
MTPVAPAAPAAAGPPDFWHLRSTGASALHDAGVTGSGGLVGVLDTGIAATHPEFAGKRVHFAQFDMDGNIVDGAPTKDFGSHGTHVSGLVAGKSAGTAPDADLAVAAVLTFKGENGYLAQILAGLNWLVKTEFRGAGDEPGVHLVNASLEVRPYNAFLLSALQAAALAPGTLAIAASGNNGKLGVDHLASPGTYAGTLAVGSTDTADQVPSFSAWGTVPEQGAVSKPDLVAPGVGISSSVPPDRYAQMSGTSMSCAVVCGIGALLVQQTPALAYDPAALHGALRNAVVSLPGQEPRSGAGVLRL